MLTWRREKLTWLQPVTTARALAPWGESGVRVGVKADVAGREGGGALAPALSCVA